MGGGVFLTTMSMAMLREKKDLVMNSNPGFSVTNKYILNKLK